eukprot:6561-Chlamydomonas_euryale.AAC.3
MVSQVYASNRHPQALIMRLCAALRPDQCSSCRWMLQHLTTNINSVALLFRRFNLNMLPPAAAVSATDWLSLTVLDT